jgi:hypothetical protein
LERAGIDAGGRQERSPAVLEWRPGLPRIRRITSASASTTSRATPNPYSQTAAPPPVAAST